VLKDNSLRLLTRVYWSHSGLTLAADICLVSALCDSMMIGLRGRFPLGAPLRKVRVW